MSRVVLSIGSNVGDRVAALQSVVDGLGDAVTAVSGVYETDPWGGVPQDPFLNAVLVADDPARTATDWLSCAHELEQAAQRIREQRWGPRTLDVDLVACHDAGGEVDCRSSELTLPHPRAHLRAFVLVPWLEVDPGAELGLDGSSRPVAELIGALRPADRAGVRPTSLKLER